LIFYFSVPSYCFYIIVWHSYCCFLVNVPLFNDVAGLVLLRYFSLLSFDAW
jgi:hypothetical protein